MVTIREEHSSIDALKIPRQVIERYSHQEIQLHGFCDASMHAYGACIYARTTDTMGHHSVRLWVSKSRVAPLRCTSLPRLELCGAALLTQLTNKLTNALHIKVDRRYFWCDSTVALAWLGSAEGGIHLWRIGLARYNVILESRNGIM